jgi:hypothetical protein
VEPDEVAGDRHDVARPGGGGEMVAPGEPGPPLADVDAGEADRQVPL